MSERGTSRKTTSGPNRRALLSHRRLTHRRPEKSPAPVSKVDAVASSKTALGPLHVQSVWLAAKRPPISHLPYLWRWLARTVYHRFQWCPDYGIEYLGVFTDEAEARYHASQAGGFVMQLPLNAVLPDIPCQFGRHDFPLSEFSSEYRNRQFPFVAVPRGQLAMLGRKIEEVETCAAGQCHQ